MAKSRIWFTSEYTTIQRIDIQVVSPRRRQPLGAHPHSTKMPDPDPGRSAAGPPQAASRPRTPDSGVSSVIDPYDLGPVAKQRKISLPLESLDFIPLEDKSLDDRKNWTSGTTAKSQRPSKQQGPALAEPIVPPLQATILKLEAREELGRESEGGDIEITVEDEGPHKPAGGLKLQSIEDFLKETEEESKTRPEPRKGSAPPLISSTSSFIYSTPSLISSAAEAAPSISEKNFVSTLHEICARHRITISLSVSPSTTAAQRFVATLSLNDQQVYPSLSTTTPSLTTKYSSKKAAKEAAAKEGIRYLCQRLQIPDPARELAPAFGQDGVQQINLYGDLVAPESQAGPPKNYIGMLQEFCAVGQGSYVPVYREFNLSSGHFAAEVEVEGLVFETAGDTELEEGQLRERKSAVFGSRMLPHKSKKQAKSNAARLAVDHLVSHNLVERLAGSKLHLRWNTQEIQSPTSPKSLASTSSSVATGWGSKKFIFAPCTLTIPNTAGLSWRAKVGKVLAELGMAPARYELVPDDGVTAMFSGYAGLKSGGKKIRSASTAKSQEPGVEGDVDERDLGIDEGLAYAKVRHMYGRENAREELARQLWFSLGEVCQNVQIELREEQQQ